MEKGQEARCNLVCLATNGRHCAPAWYGHFAEGANIAAGRDILFQKHACRAFLQQTLDDFTASSKASFEVWAAQTVCRTSWNRL